MSNAQDKCQGQFCKHAKYCLAYRNEPGCLLLEQGNDPKAAARLLAWEEMGACISAGLSTDHIAKKYDLED